MGAVCELRQKAEGMLEAAAIWEGRILPRFVVADLAEYYQHSARI